MDKFKGYIAVPVVIIFISLYLIGSNILMKTDKVSSVDDALSDITQTENTDDIEAATDKININTADIDELMQIEGIGKDIAEAVIKTREQLGGFKTIEDIKKVYGIGDGKFENMMDTIIVE